MLIEFNEYKIYLVLLLGLSFREKPVLTHYESFCMSQTIRFPLRDTFIYIKKRIMERRKGICVERGLSNAGTYYWHARALKFLHGIHVPRKKT